MYSAESSKLRQPDKQLGIRRQHSTTPSTGAVVIKAPAGSASSDLAPSRPPGCCTLQVCSSRPSLWSASLSISFCLSLCFSPSHAVVKPALCSSLRRRCSLGQQPPVSPTLFGTRSTPGGYPTTAASSRGTYNHAPSPPPSSPSFAMLTALRSVSSIFNHAKFSLDTTSKAACSASTFPDQATLVLVWTSRSPFALVHAASRPRHALKTQDSRSLSAARVQGFPFPTPILPQPPRRLLSISQDSSTANPHPPRRPLLEQTRTLLSSLPSSPSPPSRKWTTPVWVYQPSASTLNHSKRSSSSSSSPCLSCVASRQVAPCARRLRGRPDS
ncbi:hypothetical protein CGCS363_v007647 [Colletotrichum siamense]|uniref:uncharacterized protein n=1 Tax=Colletotrichum siamense TaxID=690259 RepID=UPI0018727A1A|nr:uncharacterized protein CGCS363_v007647 [Colletotrichum siamense]KAF5501537.1 hypothetical protein CGCS363_v007647 [Colletotrichum siamense]